MEMGREMVVGDNTNGVVTNTITTGNIPAELLKCGTITFNPTVVTADAKTEPVKDDKPETIYEISDLAYHVLVLMVEQNITPDDILKELASRHIVDKKVKQEKMK